jgi:hypothetical protein
MRTPWFIVFTACIGVLCAAPQRALADISIAGGAYISNTPSLAGGAVLVSSAASIPDLPIQIQGTVLAPVTKHGGYAVTAEVRGLSGGGFGGAYVGAGAGFGDLSVDHSTGFTLTAFVGKPVGPRTTVELRLYKGIQSNGTTAGFLGFRFSL